MRLAVLDASAVGGGPVTRALECAGREAQRAGIIVEPVRLYTLFGSCCVSCGGCENAGRCTSRHESIHDAAVQLAAADLLLVGVTSSVSQRDRRAEALLRRLVGSFADTYSSRGGDVAAAQGEPKRAAMLSSAPPLLGLAAALGALPYGLGGVWRILDRAGVDVVGSTSIPRRWTGPAAWDETRDRAIRLGRQLIPRRAVPSGVHAHVTAPVVPAAMPSARREPRVA